MAEISKPIDSRFLPLFNFKNDREKRLVEAENDLITFMEKLNASEINNKYNCSVNLYAFNNATNLFDLNECMEMFRCSYQYSLLEEKKNIGQSDLINYKEEIEYFFENNSYLMKLFGTNTKAFLFDQEVYNDEILQNTEKLICYNSLFNRLKNSLIESINEEIIKKLASNVPIEIKKEYALFKLLISDEAYRTLIEDFKCVSDTKNRLLYYAFEIAYDKFYKMKNLKIRRTDEHDERNEQVIHNKDTKELLITHLKNRE